MRTPFDLIRTGTCPAIAGSARTLTRVVVSVPASRLVTPQPAQTTTIS